MQSLSANAFPEDVEKVTEKPEERGLLIHCSSDTDVPCVFSLQFSFWLSESRFLLEKRPSSRREREG